MFVNILRALDKLFAWFYKRGIILYLCFFILAIFFVDFKRLIVFNQNRTLNRFRPQSFALLIQAKKDSTNLSVEELEKYEFYFRKITQYMPDRADAFGLRGFCFYHLKKKDEAISLYKKAIELNPKFFWFYHNLGSIYYKAGRYKEAVEAFEGALRCLPEDSVNFVQGSLRIYLPIVIMSKQHNPGYTLDEELRKGFEDVYTALVLSHYYQKDYKKMLGVSASAIQSALGKDGLFHYYAGIASFNLKEYNNAILFLKESLKLHPNNVTVLNYFQESLKALGENRMAQRVKIKEEIARKSEQQHVYRPAEIILKPY